MKGIIIIFPHQLFKQHPAIEPGRTIYLVEETLFFTIQFSSAKNSIAQRFHESLCSLFTNHDISIEYINMQL